MWHHENSSPTSSGKHAWPKKQIVLMPEPSMCTSFQSEKKGGVMQAELYDVTQIVKLLLAEDSGSSLSIAYTSVINLM